MGTSKQPVGAHDMRAMFFDVDGRPMQPRAFRRKHKRRMALKVTETRGRVVVTEFVGINHRAGPGAPQIYETTVFRKSTGDIAYRAWTSGPRWARAKHVWTLLRIWFGR